MTRKTFETLTSLLSKQRQREIYLGDIKCDFRKPNNDPARQLKSICNEFQFEWQIKEPTRVVSVADEDGSTQVTKTLISHIATNYLSYILSVEVPIITLHLFDEGWALIKRAKFIKTLSLACSSEEPLLKGFRISKLGLIF